MWCLHVRWAEPTQKIVWLGKQTLDASQTKIDTKIEMKSNGNPTLRRCKSQSNSGNFFLEENSTAMHHSEPLTWFTTLKGVINSSSSKPLLCALRHKHRAYYFDRSSSTAYDVLRSLMLLHHAIGRLFFEGSKEKQEAEVKLTANIAEICRFSLRKVEWKMYITRSKANAIRRERKLISRLRFLWFLLFSPLIQLFLYLLAVNSRCVNMANTTQNML